MIILPVTAVFHRSTAIQGEMTPRDNMGESCHSHGLCWVGGAAASSRHHILFLQEYWFSSVGGSSISLFFSAGKCIFFFGPCPRVPILVRLRFYETQKTNLLRHSGRRVAHLLRRRFRRAKACGCARLNLRQLLLPHLYLLHEIHRASGLMGARGTLLLLRVEATALLVAIRPTNVAQVLGTRGLVVYIEFTPRLVTTCKRSLLFSLSGKA